MRATKPTKSRDRAVVSFVLFILFLLRSYLAYEEHTSLSALPICPIANVIDSTEMPTEKSRQNEERGYLLGLFTKK